MSAPPPPPSPPPLSDNNSNSNYTHSEKPPLPVSIPIPIPLPKKHKHYAPLLPSPLNPGSPPSLSLPSDPPGSLLSLKNNKRKRPRSRRCVSEPSPTQRLLRQKAAAAFRSEAEAQAIHRSKTVFDDSGRSHGHGEDSDGGRTNRRVASMPWRWNSMKLSLSRRDGDEDRSKGVTIARARAKSETASPPPAGEPKPVGDTGYDDNGGGGDTGWSRSSFHTVDLARVQSQLLMTTEPGTAVAFPMRRKPNIAAVRPVLIFLGLICGVGLVQCLMRSFGVWSGTPE